MVCREAAWRAFDGEHLPANELTDAQKRRLMAAIDELKEPVSYTHLDVYKRQALRWCSPCVRWTPAA